MRSSALTSEIARAIRRAKVIVAQLSLKVAIKFKEPPSSGQWATMNARNVS
jgi:hypothetical protein